MDIREILAPFGEPEALAADLARLQPDHPLSAGAIYQWRSRGSIPHRWRLPLLDLAASRKIRLKAGDLSGRGS